MTGPGKYDDACTQARIATDAQAVVLIVLGGKHGAGFSVQMMHPDRLGDLARLLRITADQIEKDRQQINS